jgi:hypothetical protein
MNSAKMAALAARTRRGRVQVAIRRAFIAAGGAPLVARDFLRELTMREDLRQRTDPEFLYTLTWALSSC